MVLNPVGPLPASTYWRRRLVLLTVLVALLLVARSCAGGSPEPAKGRPSPTPTTSPSPSASPTPRPVKTTASRPGTCSDAVLTLRASTGERSYPAGSAVRFTLTVTNTGSAACRRDLGGGAMEVRVFSGKDRIWSSDDCGTDKGVSVQSLPAGGSLETGVSWPGKRSARGCPTGRPEARPGTYSVRARVGTLTSAATVFRLTG